MSIKKSAEERRNEIMDAASRLFTSRGYDETSVSDILREVGIARGTLYHHFQAKEGIMDGLIERHTANILAATQEAASKPGASTQERLVGAMQAQMQWVADVPASQLMLDHLHQPRNVLMHHKINCIMLRELPAILSQIVEDGIRQGEFNTRYPRESAEMAVAYVQAVFNEDKLSLSPEEREARVIAYVAILERMLGAQEGSLQYLEQVFHDFHA